MNSIQKKTINTANAMIKNVLLLITIMGAFAAIKVPEGICSDVNLPNFADLSLVTLNGNASGIDTTDGKVLRLTDAQAWQAGSAFSKTTMNASSFSTFFKFRITEKGGEKNIYDRYNQTGADGIVFVIQKIGSSIGNSGLGIGYADIDQSIGIEFDTWGNGEFPASSEISSNHVAIDTNGNMVHDAQYTATITPDFDDGNIWYAWIDYDGKKLEVRTSQSSVRPETITVSRGLDIPSILGQSSGYVGFTSGTGKAWGNHDIISWVYRDSYQPIKCSDNDGDGFTQEGGVCGQSDCDDTDAIINPLSSEVCGNNKDDDCDGETDEGCLCPAQKVLGEDGADIEALRVFRDSTLAKSAMGRRIIAVYYNNADSINAALDSSPALRAATRSLLGAIVTIVAQ
jgi:hypothetical protein